jgi:hypothetical protein
MTERTAKIMVSLSTNPSVSGRYFVDVRDTTGGRNRQLTTRTNDADYVLDFIRQAKGQSQAQGINLTVEDRTGELVL